MHKRFTFFFASFALFTSACAKDSANPPPQPYGQPYAYGPYTSPPQPMPPPQQSPAVMRPINIGALLSALPMSPCAPAEVSPGNWVGFDCTPNTVIAQALQTIVSAVPHQAGQPQRFSSKSLASSGLPETVDHRSIGLEGPIKNQGAVGTCTAVSLSTAMEAALRRMGVADNVSALHLWSNYGQPAMGSAGDSNLNKRVAPSASWPYDPAAACKLMKRSLDSCGSAYGVTPNTGALDPQLQAQKQAADASGRYTLVGIERISNPDPANFAKILAGGDDLWVAFEMDKSSWNSSKLQNGVIPDYNGRDGSGHAVVLAGYRSVGNLTQFLIHNSWGPNWGEGGYGWISENMIRSQLRAAYRLRVGHAGGSTPALPTIPGLPTAIPGLPGFPGLPGQQPQPQSGSCAQGQVADMIGGQCVAPCPNGYPPAAGVCAPSVPGMTPPGGQPAPQPGQPAKACAQGQVADMMSGQCAAPCSDGNAPVGGLCLPRLPSQ